MNSPKQTDIKSAESLKLAISSLKQQIDQQEAALGKRIGEVPGALFKSASGAILPAVLNASTLSGVWNLLKLVPVAQSLFSLLRKKTGK